MTTRSTPNGTLLQVLTDTQSAMVRLFEHRAKALGFNRPQWRVLSGLLGNDGMTQTELSEMIFIARSPLGKIVDKLEALGYIERRADPNDRRINRLYLTAAVSPLIEPVETLLCDMENAVIERISDKTELVEQLTQMHQRLGVLLSRELATT